MWYSAYWLLTSYISRTTSGTFSIAPVCKFQVLMQALPSCIERCLSHLMCLLNLSLV
jgi:hypothetical protein